MSVVFRPPTCVVVKTAKLASSTRSADRGVASKAEKACRGSKLPICRRGQKQPERAVEFKLADVGSQFKGLRTCRNAEGFANLASSVKTADPAFAFPAAERFVALEGTELRRRQTCRSASKVKLGPTSVVFKPGESAFGRHAAKAASVVRSADRRRIKRREVRRRQAKTKPAFGKTGAPICVDGPTR